jgi:hypothetical protein
MLKNVAQTVQYVAWDTVAGAGKAGDASNHTLRAVGDGTAYTPAASPAEVDGTNLPGVYKVALAAGEFNYNLITLGGKSSTSGVVLIPITFATFDPAAAGSRTLPVPDYDSLLTAHTSPTQDQALYAAWVGAIAPTQLDGSLNLQYLAADGTTVVLTVAAADTEAAALAAAVLDATASSHDTSGTIGAKINAAASAGDPWSTDLPGSYGSGTAGNIVGNNLNATVSSRAATSDSRFANLDAAVSTRLATSGYTAPDNSDIAAILTDVGAGLGTACAAIKAKTDTIPSSFPALDGSGRVTIAPAGLDAIDIETGVNARQALSPILAAAAGVLSGAGTGTVTIKGGNVATTRIVAACDEAGNRSSVTLTLPT